MHSKKFDLIRGAALVALACGLALPGTAAACPPDEDGEYRLLPTDADAKVKLITNQKANSQKTTHKTYTVMVTPDHEVKVLGEDGEIEVLLDGKIAPKSQVIRMDGGLKVINEQGDVITYVHMHDNGAIGVSGAPIAATDVAYGALAPAAGQARVRLTQDAIAADGQPRVMLGITMTDVPEELAEMLKLDADTAILLSRVSPGLPAGKAGMKANDVIISIDGKKPATRDLLTRMLSKRDPGDRLPMLIKRGNDFVEVEVELEAFDGERLSGSLGLTGGVAAGNAWAPRVQMLERERATAQLRSDLATMSARAAELAAAQADASGNEAARLADEMAMVSRSMAELANELAVASARSPGQGQMFWRGVPGGGPDATPFSGVIELEGDAGQRFFVQPGVDDDEIEVMVERLAEAFERSAEERAEMAESMAEHIERAMEAHRRPLEHLGEHQEDLVHKLRELEERLGDTNRWHNEFAPRVEQHTEHMMHRFEELEERMNRIEDRLDERLSNLERMLERALREGRERH